MLFQISRNSEMFSTWLMNIYLHFKCKRFCALTTRERLVTLFMPKKSSTLGELFVTYFALEQLFSCVDGLMLFQNIRSFEMFPTVVTDQSHMLLLIFSSLKDFSHWSQEYEEFCALLYASKDHLFWKMICHINSMEFWVDRIWLDAFLDHSELCNIFHMIYKIYHCAVVCGFLIQFHAGKIFHTYHMNEPCVSTP